MFIQFCRQKLNLEIRPDDIVNCHRLQKSTQSIHRPMVIRLASQRVRAEILSERHRLRASNIYINEHLTRSVSEMFKSARKMLQDKLIVEAWTRGGRLYVKIREHDRPSLVNTPADLDRLCH